MTNHTTLTLTQYLSGVSTKLFSAAEVIAECQNEQQRQKELNIFVTEHTPTKNEVAVQSAAPLAGVPLAIKDNISTKGLRTTASSTVLDQYIPAVNATVSEKLQQAGATCIGKTNLDAWAHGSSTETSQYGRTLNPRNPEHLPGGSSGGSAAAVAANTCIAAVGTETAGSIRQPAAWCGVVGLKPTYGRVSRNGIIAMASSTDSPGPITKTVRDAAIMLNYMAGHDKYDGTTSPQAVPDFTRSIGKSLKGLRVGVLYETLAGLEGVTPHISAAAAVLANLGADVRSAQALDPNYAISVYTVVQRAEVSSNLARFDGLRYGNDRSFFGDEAKRRIMLGTFTLSKGYADQYYNTAQKVRTAFIEDFAQLFSQFDVLISATSPSFAKKIGVTEDAAMFGELEDMLLEPSSITGLPGISVPCFRDPQTNLSLGLNIMAPMWQEETVIMVADAYEQATDWNSWRSADAK